jgi:hypothetical protein
MMFRFTVLPALAVAALLAGPPSLAAQPYGHAYGRDDNDHRAAYDNGYRRGLEHVERDARNGRAMNVRNDRDYRDADWGYDRHDGSREEYQEAFRNGFQRGYAEAYQRSGGYGYGQVPPRYDRDGDRDRDDRAPVYREERTPAFNNGYQDGLQKGREDAEHHKSFDPMRHDWFRDADHHYNSHFGPKDAYRPAYRDGFRAGYQTGFRMERGDRH